MRDSNGAMAEAKISRLSFRGLAPIAQLAERKPHGTRLRYMSGCHCLKCRMANSNYETMRSKARKAGGWNGIVDAAPARQHILKMSRAGVGYKMVAEAAKTSHTIVFGIRSGRRPRARALTVRRILAVTTDCRGDKSLVSARSTWAKIRLLQEEGYALAHIAKMLGYKSPALQLRKDRITARSRATIEALYRGVMTGEGFSTRRSNPSSASLQRKRKYPC